MIFRQIFIYFLFSTNIFAQDLNCDKQFLSEEVDVEAKIEATAALQFFNNEILPILNDANLDFFPTKFQAILIIDARGKVNSIKTISHNYSEEVKIKLLEKFQKLKFEAALKDNKKVCSEYYFVIGCILYD